jgi:cell division protein FtsW (lipid II flippase)
MENQYQTPNQDPFQYQNKPVLTVGDWFVTILITAIPLVGLIMLFVWAFSSDTNPNKANWAKAQLIWMFIGIAIAIFIFGVIGVGIFKGLL